MSHMRTKFGQSMLKSYNMATRSKYDPKVTIELICLND